MLASLALALLSTTTPTSVDPHGDVERAAVPATVRAHFVEAMDPDEERRRNALIEVEGRVGLTPWEAEAEAERELVETVLSDLEREVRRGRLAGDASWLPTALERRALERWRSDLEPEDLVDVVRHDLIEHDHAGFASFQVRLAARVDTDLVDEAMDGFEREIARTRRRATAFGLGAIGLWGLLGLAFVWFDRLTRGYMPWRTGLVLGGIGAALPAMAWFLI